MSFDLNEAALILARTPLSVNELLRDLPDSWSGVTEGPDTWSPYDIVGHLAHGEKTDWIARTRIILAQGPSVAFEPFDRFAQQQTSAGKELNTLLDEFAHLRLRNLDLLQGMEITTEQLGWTGEHPEFGTVTLGQLLATWVAHDLGHLAQIGRVMARRYTIAVGPWQKYLPIIGD